jgi:hypothetical protein
MNKPDSKMQIKAFRMTRETPETYRHPFRHDLTPSDIDALQGTTLSDWP